MLDRPISQLTVADIERLVELKWAESKLIEYKADMYKFKEAKANQRQEFCKDVLSFANTVGGTLILGVTTESGIPTEISPIECRDPDNLQRQMLDILRTGSDPAFIPSMRAIEIDGKFVFVIQVHESITAPHGVVWNDGRREFWARNSAGAYRMDTSELRQAITLSQSIFDRMRDFHAARVQQIHNREMIPVPFETGAKLILHLLPFSAFGRTVVNLDVEVVLNWHASAFPPMSTQTGHSRITIDGVCNFWRPIGEQSPCRSYTQIYRNGIVEAVAGGIVIDVQSGQKFEVQACEKYLWDGLRSYLAGLRTLGIAPPLWCFIALDGVNNTYVSSNASNERINRDRFYLPEFEITDLDTDPVSQLRFACDVMWNAAGVAKSETFDRLLSP